MRGYVFIVLFLVALDQTTKLFVKGFNVLGFRVEGMYLGESYQLIGDYVRLTFVENPGMAFGISFGAGKIILTLLTVAIVMALVVYLSRLGSARPSVKLSVTLILSGAIGNLIDRLFYGAFYGEAPLFYGKVVDFIQVDIPDVTIFGSTYTYFPVFNVADSCVTIGVILLMAVNKHAPSFFPVKTQNMNTDETKV